MLKREVEQIKQEKEQAVLDAELLRIQVARRRQQADGDAGAAAPAATAASAAVSEEELSREALIKDHYQARINQLSAQLHYADARAVAFFEECKALALKVGAHGSASDQTLLTSSSFFPTSSSPRSRACAATVSSRRRV